MTLKEAKSRLTKIGVTISKKDGEYRVNMKGGKEDSAYYTNDIDDAFGTGVAMAKGGGHPQPIWPKFFDQYLETALWSTTDNSTESGGDPLDDNYGVGDIDQESIDKAIVETNDFIKANRVNLEKVSELFGASEGDHGHDFWLTRNGHGAGFWDRGYGELGDKLSKAAKVYGTSDIYIGDDGKLHIQ